MAGGGQGVRRAGRRASETPRSMEPGRKERLYIRLSTYEPNRVRPPMPPAALFPAELSTELSELDALFRGFADPTRLRLLNALVPGSLCVSDLVEVLDLPQPLVSRHLAYLRHVGLVRTAREARFARYALAEPSKPTHASLLSCVRTCFVGVGALEAERAAAALRARPTR
jgi:ArsR family transcriptional regulator, arsenate/arsenite/antimonite-responsive transcriptional repressor